MLDADRQPLFDMGFHHLAYRSPVFGMHARDEVLERDLALRRVEFKDAP